MSVSQAKEKRMERRTMAASDRLADAQAVDASAAVAGEWGAVFDWPVIAVHAALLPTGRVLAYDSVGPNPTESYPDDQHTKTRAALWDPTEPNLADSFHRVDLVGTSVRVGVNIFCSGLAHLMNGDVFVAGGNKDSLLNGIKATHVFDGQADGTSDPWTRTEDMAVERWYPTVTPLANGEMFISSGGNYTEGTHDHEAHEVREVDGDIRLLTTAYMALPADTYPWVDAAPDGRAFVSGPQPTMHSFDTSGTGSIQSWGDRDAINRSYGSHALYDVGKILVAGGGRPPVSSAETIDLNGTEPKVQSTDSMEYPRRQHNLTVLADGTVLATGGLSSDAGTVDLNAGVMPAELWNPDTGQWTTLSSMEVTRQYHSTALLLPDARVLVAGGGVCGDCATYGYSASNAQVFSPPYLFESDGSPAARPRVTSAPAVLPYDRAFEVCTPDAGSASDVALVRIGAVTHGVNMDQRYLPLGTGTKTGAVLHPTSPESPDVAPPGIYMLFVLDADGTPSQARMVRLMPGAAAPPACDNPPSPPPPRRDDDPPETVIRSVKKKSRTVTIRFRSDEPGSTFTCRLDGRHARPCSSPRTVRLAPGRHRFSVRAADAAGNVDPTPASTRFRVRSRR